MHLYRKPEQHFGIDSNELPAWIRLDVVGVVLHLRLVTGKLLMLEDCRAGKIDTIMTKSISRFGRDTVEVISILRELNQLGINVIFENDNIDTATEDSELVITIISAVAQADNESRRKNILFKTVSAEDLFGESLAETMKRKTYKIAESHPAIISKEDFNRVQEMKKQRSRKKVDYLPDEQHDE